MAFTNGPNAFKNSFKVVHGQKQFSSYLFIWDAPDCIEGHIRATVAAIKGHHWKPNGLLSNNRRVSTGAEFNQVVFFPILFFSSFIHFTLSTVLALCLQVF
jgi:hypothetical protein